jgi:superfamily I DNA/RNA helicase/RecB family exonuclease
MSTDHEVRVTPEEWPGYIDDGEGPQLIVGGPGTGKTEFLVRRAKTLIEEGHGANLLVVTFSRRGTADLDARISKAVARSMPAVDITTYHSLARRLLETYPEPRGWDRPPEVLPGPDQERLVADLLAEEVPEDWSPVYRGLLTTTTFADEVTDFVLRCREQLITSDQLAGFGRADWEGLAPFVDRYDAALRQRGVIDYGTLLSEAAALLDDPAVLDAVSRQYRYVLVDEYQDTTRAQAVLLDRLSSRHRNITAAADPYQSIYSFRGADLENVARFPEEFGSPDGKPARRIVLTTSFRTPKPILDAAVRITARELPGAAGKVLPAGTEGSVETYRFEQQVEEAEWIASEIERLHLEQRIPYGRIAVFTRSKRRFLGPLSRALERRRIPHDRPGARLVEQPAVRFTLDVVIAATGTRAEANLAVRRILLGPLFRTPLARMREIERDRIRRSMSWPEAIRTLVPDGAVLGGFIEDPAWATERAASVGLWELWSTLPQIQRVVADPAAGEHRAAWSSLSQVLGRWNDREPGGTLDQYRRFAEADEFEASPLLAYQAIAGERVTLTTLHQSKGLEFDVVFIADAVEGVFPDLRTRDSLLNTRHLQPSLPTDTAGYLRFRLDEERRLAYTAMTRATRRVVWTATDAGYSEGTGIPSRFLALAAGTKTVAEAAGRPAGRAHPVTPREAESALRRMLVDPSVPAAKRLGAAAVLATGNEHGLRSPSQFSGYLEPGADDGVMGDTMRLSPSQADAYETCPRRYALERRLGIGDSDSVYAEFGTLIHSVLEAVESKATDRGDQHATLDEALEELDRQLYPGRFGGGAFDTAWRARGRGGLTALYEAWPSSGMPVAHEHELHFDHDGTEWIGFADRIEARDGRLAIVDYKTSKSATGIEEAKSSIQLGFYVLATREDDELEGAPTADHAELWFPLAPLKTGITVRQFDIDQLPDITERMSAVASGISAEHWPPRPNDACPKCPVRSICPARPEGREAYAS